MSEDRQRIEELLTLASQAHSPDTKVTLFLEIAGLADSLNDRDLAYRARYEILTEADYCSRFDDYCVAFVWCYSVASKDPERYDLNSLLRDYSSFPSRSLNFTNFSKEQYFRLCDDVVAKLKQHGLPTEKFYIEHRSAMADLGLPRMARQLNKLVRQEQGTDTNLNSHFKCGRELEYLNFIGDDQLIRKTAMDWFQQQPGWTSGWVVGQCLLPLLRLGDVQMAMNWHRATCRQIVPGQGFFWSWGPHLSFLGLTGNFVRGVRLFQTMLPWALGQRDQLSRYHFFEHAIVLFRELRESGQKTVSLVLPPEVPLRKSSTSYSVAEVDQWIEQELRQLARLADIRNGNRYYTKWIGKMLDLSQYRTRYPVSE